MYPNKETAIMELEAVGRFLKVGEDYEQKQLRIN